MSFDSLFFAALPLYLGSGSLRRSVRPYILGDELWKRKIAAKMDPAFVSRFRPSFLYVLSHLTLSIIYEQTSQGIL
jgi:hypothetical protein